MQQKVVLGQKKPYQFRPPQPTLPLAFVLPLSTGQRQRGLLGRDCSLTSGEMSSSMSAHASPEDSRKQEERWNEQS